MKIFGWLKKVEKMLEIKVEKQKIIGKQFVFRAFSKNLPSNLHPYLMVLKAKC